jgi:hypothetical protein
MTNLKSLSDKFGRIIETGDQIVYPLVHDEEPKLGFAKIISIKEPIVEVEDLDNGLFLNNKIGMLSFEYFKNVVVVKKWHEV